jgi:hypothetical protein
MSGEMCFVREPVGHSPFVLIQLKKKWQLQMLLIIVFGKPMKENYFLSLKRTVEGLEARQSYATLHLFWGMLKNNF